jgi:predicted DNA-binding protein
MKRTNVHLPLPLLARLKKQAKKKDLTVAELIRRSAEHYLNLKDLRKTKNEPEKQHS